MNFLELVKDRYSVRAYSDRPVEREKLDYILECARLAPSATNAQPWKIYVITDHQVRVGIQECYPREWFKQAPVLIVVCVNDGAAWIRNYDGKNHADVDGSIIAEHICLAAADCGLGTCWVCNFDADVCAGILELPKEWRPLAILPIGYPVSDSIPEKKRKPIDEIVKFI